jgi:hypothetical protein
MARSIIGTAKLLAVLAFAIPAAVAGIDLFFKGERTIGAGLVVVAILMVAVEEYIMTPDDLPGKVAGKAVETVIKEPDEDDSGNE